MKKTKIVLISLVTISIILLIICLIFAFLTKNKEKVVYNNMIEINDCITKKYSESEINKLVEEISTKNLDLEQIQKQYKVECIRKTYQGYYVVFLQEDGTKLFIFFDEDLKRSNYCITKNILGWNDFNFIEKNKTTKKQILNFDKNIVAISSFSSDNTTKHIIKEGVLIFMYDYEKETVKEINFIAEELLSSQSSSYSNSFVPYIIAQDRT